MDLENALEGLEIDILNEWIESGRTAKMPEELAHYLSLLEVVRALMSKNQPKNYILTVLTSTPYHLSDYKARKVYADSINFFFIDSEVKKSAWRNLYAEKLEKAAEFTLSVAKTVKDIEVYTKIIKEAFLMRELNEKDVDDFPNEVFEKPNKIYSLTPEDIGLPSIDRNLLAAQIDQLPINENEKLKVRRDATIEKPKLLLDDFEEKN